MNYTGLNRLKLSARNEGKIKSYESCYDVRAWSHDIADRDQYLRQWMKCDMPVCVLPVSTLTNFLRIMTCRSRGKATPRCHPDCKSRILLESICNSCHAMKECLKNDASFDKYFEDEEFETSHWPCERCLEALKSIKMFWKIIIENLFNVNLSKNEKFEKAHCSRTESIRTLAKDWQKEIVQQALFVKNITPIPFRNNVNQNSCSWKQTKCVKKETNIRFPKSKTEISGDSVSPKPVTKNIRSANSSTRCSMKSCKVKTTGTGSLCSSALKLPHKKICKCTSVRVKLLDIGCETCSVEKEREEIKAYKNNLDYLQNRYNLQSDEIERLKKENISLKIELQNIYNTRSWKSSIYTAADNSPDIDAITLVPKPFESCVEENINNNPVKNIDSEMIITMKNCKNESFRHVSLLQVLHKTNVPIDSELNIKRPSCKREDPVELLTKVQNTFGAIVKRELSIVNDRRQSAKKCNIDASFHTVNSSRSVPSYSTLSTRSESSMSNLGRQK